MINPFDKIEHYKHRAEELIEQAVFCDTRPLDQNEGKTLKEFLKLNKSEKFLEILHIFKKILPKDILQKRDFKKLFYNLKELPFRPDQFSFEGIKGSGATSCVHLLKSKNPEKSSWALKVLKNKYVKQNFDSLDQAGQFFVKEYQQVRDWYGQELSDFFLPEYIIKLKNPRKSEKCDSLAILQPYQGQELQDVFTEIPKNELVNLLQENKNLGHKFVHFINATLDHEAKTGETLDLIGRKNISLVDHGKDARFVVLDPHWIHWTDKDKDDSALQTRQRLNYLKEILDEINPS